MNSWFYDVSITLVPKQREEREKKETKFDTILHKYSWKALTKVLGSKIQQDIKNYTALPTGVYPNDVKLQGKEEKSHDHISAEKEFDNIHHSFMI